MNTVIPTVGFPDRVHTVVLSSEIVVYRGTYSYSYKIRLDVQLQSFISSALDLERQIVLLPPIYPRVLKNV
jgi:hypothetical protein